MTYRLEQKLYEQMSICAQKQMYDVTGGGIT